MPFTKGTPKPINSGRQKGKQTRLSKEVASRLESMGCDPVAGMVRLAMDEDMEPGIRARMFSELIQYIYPKLRATDHRFVDADGNDRAIQLGDVDKMVADFDAADIKLVADFDAAK